MTSKNETSAAEVRDLLSKIAKDPNAIKKLTAQEAAEARRAIHPFGNMPTGEPTYVNMSVINFRKEYETQLMMTAMIGFIYRLAHEYEPEEIEEETARYHARMSKNQANAAKITTEHEKRCKQIKDNAQAVVLKFLNRHLRFNPDKHLRKAHTENAKDPERNQAVRNEAAVLLTGESIDAKLITQPEKMYRYLKEHLLATYSLARAAEESTDAIIKALASGLPAEDKQGILYKKRVELGVLTQDMAKISIPMQKAGTLNAWKISPPADVYHQFRRYYDNHYEELRGIVRDTYDEKPDIEYGVIMYDSHKTPEEAEVYRKQYADSFRASVYCVESNKINLLGPFKTNRERTNYYNQNTEVLSQMMKKAEEDHKLGADLASAKKLRFKKKNIEEMGPDAPGLAEYAKVANMVATMGAKPGMTMEEQKQYAELKEKERIIREDLEVPDDAIQMDVWRTVEKEDGSQQLERSIMYTQAEAPIHLLEGGPQGYQPGRGEGTLPESVLDASRQITVKSSSRAHEKSDAY